MSYFSVARAIIKAQAKLVDDDEDAALSFMDDAIDQSQAIQHEINKATGRAGM